MLITLPLAIIELAKMDCGSMSITNGNTCTDIPAGKLSVKTLNSPNRKKSGPNPGRMFAGHYPARRSRENLRRYLKNGSYGYHEYNIQPVYQDGKIVAIEGFINDTTERKQAEDLVRNLSQMLIEAQESERKRLSYELHDSIAQNLSSLKIGCDMLFTRPIGHLS